MKTAMILAAGRGERLKPFTDKLPKALCKLFNKPLIEHHILKLVYCGFDRVVINHAHLGGKIRQYLGDGKRWGIEICYSPEPPGGLETGGGIFNALPLLGTEPFLVVNADIFTDFDFKSLQPPQNSLINYLLITNPAHKLQGDFDISDEGYLTNDKTHTFAGIAYYHPYAFKACHIGRYSIIPLVRQLILKKQVRGEFFSGHWVDIGSPERLEVANAFPPHS